MQLDKLDQGIFICIFNFDKCHLSSYNVTIYTPINLLMLLAAAAKSLQSCPTLCDPIDGSPQGSPVPGILQSFNSFGNMLIFPVWGKEHCKYIINMDLL